MPGRRPGPQCVTDGEAIDAGTNCRHRSSAPGPLGLGPESTRQPAQGSVMFGVLWAAYPSSKPYLDLTTGKVPEGFDNQCAIKISLALLEAGVKLERFKGAVVFIKGARIAIRAQELAEWLKIQSVPGIAPAETITGERWESKIRGRTGIVYFADYWTRGNEKLPTGDHIDLWNGSRMTASGVEGVAVTFLRFGLGIESGPWFSSLNKAKTIWFWEVK